jgi:hypothetical protein
MFEVIEVVPEPGKPQSNRKLKPVYAKPQKYDMPRLIKCSARNRKDNKRVMGGARRWKFPAGR